MIQTPPSQDALPKLSAAAKKMAKAGIRLAARLVGKSPTLKKLLVQTVKRFPALDRRMRASVNPLAAMAGRRAEAGGLSPAGQAILRRLQPDARKKS
jgi:hypothetical protein